ncbi:tetratricopeptide repeat protein [Metasolibacillus meyeri]|uniref:tetratricopeptide repeat protein n=1 Tax=Metasolibacillus meyeri TaxID=1071052 RepID=UPI000D30AE9C|nr:hypothetical protein [Metasolibacillus meyeri]
MQLKESTRKYILLGMILFIVIGLVSAKVMAKKQDDEFLADDALYQYSSQLYSQGSYEEASEMVNELLKRQPKSEVANYLGGLIAANKADYTQAAILLQKTLDVNPYKVEDPMFMLQFAEVLFFAGRPDDAKVVLEKCREWGWAPESYPDYQGRVTEILTQIENMQ